MSVPIEHQQTNILGVTPRRRRSNSLRARYASTFRLIFQPARFVEKYDRVKNSLSSVVAGDEGFDPASLLHATDPLGSHMGCGAQLQLPRARTRKFIADRSGGVSIVGLTLASAPDVASCAVGRNCR